MCYFNVCHIHILYYVSQSTRSLQDSCMSLRHFLQCKGLKLLIILFYFPGFVIVVVAVLVSLIHVKYSEHQI